MFCFFFVFFLAATSSSIPPSVFWSAGPQKFPHPLAAGQVCLQRCVCIHAKCLQQWCITKRCITSYTCTILLGHDTKDRWWMVGAVLGVVFSNKSWILDVMHCGKKQLHISFNESISSSKKLLPSKSNCDLLSMRMKFATELSYLSGCVRVHVAACGCMHEAAASANLHLFSECWEIYSTVTTKQSPSRLNVQVQKF